MWGARPYGFYLRVFWVGLKPHIIAFLKVAVCRCSTKIGLLKNFVKVTGKHLVFCNKVAGLEPATLFILKKRLQHKSLPANLAKFFKRPTFVENLEAAAFGNVFLYNTFGRLLLHFRRFNLRAKKFLEFLVKPTTTRLF